LDDGRGSGGQLSGLWASLKSLRERLKSPWTQIALKPLKMGL
jgi:hypothetical protein